MSFITRFIQSFRPNRYVGRDLEGNRFFEHPNPNDSSRTKRTVQYREAEDVWDYIGGAKRLPVQWSSWLSHTRPHPPTLEELQADMARQQRVLANVKLIEARDREERAQMLRLEDAATSHVSNRLESETSVPPETVQQPPPLAEAATGEGPPPKPENSLPKMNTGADPYKPETWDPRAARTRGRGG
ncbi:hypothetical protein FPV67DRAFT_1668932 [Lyophyllum atratum]|nr:hypothetical protein FPV67DRAFT_1668932 [Lyophyllum atratum]